VTAGYYRTAVSGAVRPKRGKRAYARRRRMVEFIHDRLGLCRPPPSDIDAFYDLINSFLITARPRPAFCVDSATFENGVFRAKIRGPAGG